MDKLLVEFCRSGTLDPLRLGMRPADVVKSLEKPGKVKNGHGDDCFQWYEYSSLQLLMRCFSRTSGIRRGPGQDLRLAAITIEFSGDAPVTLPAAITRIPIASAASIGLQDACRILAEHGVETIRDDKMARRDIGDAAINLISGMGGFVSHISAGWRPGGWFYSEENMTGTWV